MKRWFARAYQKAVAGSAAAIVMVGILAGCQPTFMTREMYEAAHIPQLKNLEQNHNPITAPITGITAKPATVLDPDRPPQYLSLQQAIAIALENGHVSSRGGAGAGIGDTSLVSFQGGSQNTQTERIRVLALAPAIASAAIEHALSRFDPIWINSINYVGTDAIPGVPNLPGYLGTVPGQTATFQSALVKALPTGGIAELSFLADYRLLSNQANNPFAFGPLNPQYSLRPSIGIEQPLWKDWGVDINQLLPRFPNVLGQGLVGTSVFSAFSNHQGALSNFVERGQEGILISRLRFDQARAEFERNVHILMVNTEVAYWNLYQKYGQLYAFEENMRVMHKAWQDSYNQYKAERLAPELYFQVLGQYQEFRGERLRALNEVLKAEQELRTILGLSVEDGTRLVPITPPTLAELKPDWKTSVQDALNLRPELQLARDNLRYHQYLLSIQKNFMKPDLRFYARYEPFGDGSTLTGNGTFTDASGSTNPTSATRSLMNSHLADWQMGLHMSVPLGYRAEMASVRSARLQLTQAYLLLKDQEEKAIRNVNEQSREVEHWYERIKVHRAERLGYLDSLKTHIFKVKAGKETYGEPAFLEAQRRYSAALVKEYDAVAQYNNSLARLEWVKGTILRYNNVHISEGALPECVQVRAVEREKERSKSLYLRERPDSLYQPGRVAGMKDNELPPIDAPPLEEAAEQTRRLVVPAKHEFKVKPVVQPAILQVPADKTPSSDVIPVDFKAQSAPKPLPRMETMPAVPLIPLQTISFGSKTGSAGFITIEEQVVADARNGAASRMLAAPQVLAPTVVRAAIGGPQTPGAATNK